MGYCNNCGTDAGNARFCPNCGAAVAGNGGDNKYAKVDKLGGLYGIGLLILSFVCFNSDPPLVTILLAAGIIAGCIFCFKRKYKGKFFTVIAMILGVMCLLAGISQAGDFGLIDIPSDNDYNERYDNYRAETATKNNDNGSTDSSSTVTKADPTATPTPVPTEAPVETVQEEQPDEQPAEKPATGLDPDLKAFLDSYESYVDEYVAFMKKYNANPTDMNLLADYTTIMAKYTDFATKIEQYNSKEMSTEDAKYYLEVTTRCTKKMMDIY
jgi:hypothetical protein